MDPKRCREVQRLMGRYLDGELAPQERAHVEQEVAGCDACRAELAQLQKLRALVREVYLGEVARADLAPVVPAIMERLRTRTARGFFPFFSDWLDRLRLGLASPAVPAGVAATVVVAAAAAFFLYLSSTGGRGPAAPPGPPAVAVETASPPAGPAVAQAPPAAGTPAMANNRRPAYQEKDFRKNECRITSYNVSSGTVIIDVDPDGDEPAVVWHFTDDQAPSDREDDRI